MTWKLAIPGAVASTHEGSGALERTHGTGTTTAPAGCAPIGSLFFTCGSGVGTVVASIT